MDGMGKGVPFCRPVFCSSDFPNHRRVGFTPYVEDLFRDFWGEEARLGQGWSGCHNKIAMVSVEIG